MGSALTYKLVIHDKTSGEDLASFDFSKQEFEESAFMSDDLQKEIDKNRTLYERRVADKIAQEIDELESDIIRHYSDPIRYFLELIRKYEEYAKWSGEASSPGEAKACASEMLFSFLTMDEIADQL